MTPLEQFARRRLRGADTLERAAAALEASGLDVAAATRDLHALAGRARAGRFHVLLIGCFSSGKSTLLNALLGEPVLPVKVNPCTAILTELVYGDPPSVEVRHRDGRAETMTPKAFTEAYQLRTAEVGEAGAEVSDRFGGIDRAVVSWPLPLLGNGVVLVDTPGLDDDDARTARTLRSLPEADAVIVVLNASRFLTDLERRLLRRELLPRGLTNLFFPVTMADLLSALSDDPERERRELEARARRALGPLCVVDGADRFDERFFPLDARGGLHARWDRAAARRREPPDADALEATGLAAFERALERFLVEERGRAELAHLASTVRRVARDVEQRASLDRATASASVEELRRRQADLEPRFDELRRIAHRVARTVDQFVDRQRALVWQDLRASLARAEEELPDAVSRFDLGGLAGLDLLTPRGRERVEAQLREQLEVWLAERVAAWQRELRPRLEAAFDELRKQLAGDARDFDDLSGRIVTDFAGAVVKVPGPEPAAGDEPPAVERWFAVAVGAALLSPGTMAAGWAEGFEGAFKGAAGRLGARVALLALGALLGPIGWAGLLLYVVSDAVLLALTGATRLQRLREQVAAGLEGKLVAQADAARDDVAARVGEALAPLRDGIVGAAEADAARLWAQLEGTIAAREQAARDAADRAARWDAAVAALQLAVADVDALLAERE